MKPLTEEHLAVLRRHMVELIDIEYDLASEEIGRERPSERVREALMRLPRHLFVPPQIAALAYENRPLPIGFDKTISQPFLSALMVDLLDLGPEARVLEVGTGLGYQTALLSELAGAVFSVDVVEEFVAVAEARLKLLGRTNVSFRVGDGSKGWSEEGPFDAILVSAATKALTPEISKQLKVGGRIVLPVGDEAVQQLIRAERRNEEELEVSELMPVRFTQLESAF